MTTTLTPYQRYNNSDKGKARAERFKERTRDDIEHRARENERQRLWLLANPDKARAKQERKNEARNAKRQAQLELIAGRPKPSECEICGKLAEVVFDHCHTNEHFRGWLCDACNTTLGNVGDSVALLRRMADYLESQEPDAWSDERVKVAGLGLVRLPLSQPLAQSA